MTVLTPFGEETVTFYVTFSDPKAPTHTVRVEHTGDERKPRVFKVEVTTNGREDERELRSRAMGMALPLYNAWIEAHYGNKAIVPTLDPVTEELLEYFSLEEVQPLIDAWLQDVASVAGKAVRLELSGHGTASTDCRGSVTFNPQPILEGRFSTGRGTLTHESLHIRLDVNGTKRDRKLRPQDLPYGIQMLERANKEGGEVLGHILNLIMDRRADYLGCRDFPGIAHDNYYRRGDLMPGERFDPVQDQWVNRRPGISQECHQSVYVDFAYACKKHTKGVHPCVRRCIKLVNRATKRVNAGKRKYVHLLTVSKEVLNILRVNETAYDRQQQLDRDKREEQFKKFMKSLQQMIYGPKASPTMSKAFRKMMAQRAARNRKVSLAQLPATLSQLARPGRGGVTLVGGSADGRVIDVPANPVAYAQMLASVAGQVSRLRRLLQRLSIPERHDITGLQYGDLDLNALPELVTGQPDVMKITRIIQALDLAVSFGIDVSGSMSGEAYEIARGLAVAFNQAMLGFKNTIDGHFFAFNHNVYRCGPVARANGIAGVPCGGGTSEAFALEQMAIPMMSSRRRRRRIVLVACDAGPARPDLVEAQCARLLKQGIVPIRFLIGVDAAPGTYPIELFFDSWAEFIREMEKTFGQIFAAARC
jgi:hypothetical protein